MIHIKYIQIKFLFEIITFLCGALTMEPHQNQTKQHESWQPQIPAFYSTLSCHVSWCFLQTLVPPVSPFAGKTQFCFDIELEWVCSWIGYLWSSECQMSGSGSSWHMNSAHWCHGSSEECINDLKTSTSLEERVPIEWFHHGSIKDPDPLIHWLKVIINAVTRA